MTTATKEMKPTYKIFVLDSEEYDTLHQHYPMKKEDLEGSLGFAYGKTKEAFVRRTNVPEWDEETILHEAQELLNKYSSHEDENNIRWKKGKDIFASIIPAIVGILAGPLGPLVAGGLAAGTSAITQKNMSSAGEIRPLPTILGGLGGALGASAMAPGVAASKAVGGRYLGQVLSGTQQAMTGSSGASKLLAKGSFPGAGTASSPIQANPIYVTPGATMQEAMTPAQQAAAASGSAFGKITSTLGSPVAQNVLGSTVGSGIGSTLANTVSKTPTVDLGKINVTAPSSPANSLGVTGVGSEGTLGANIGGVTSTPKPNILGNIGKEVGKLVTPQNIAGVASLGASMLPKTPQFQMPSYVSDLQSKLMAGQALSPLGQQARTSLSEILKSTPQELYPTANDAYYNAALRRTEEAYSEASKNLDAAYNVAGVYGSGEHLAEKAKLQEKLARTKSALASETEQRRFELARTAQYQAIQDSLGVDRDTMDDIAGLTGLDVQTAAMMYGANVADVNAIRESLGTLGVELLIRGTQKTGTNTGSNVNITLGQ